MNLNPTKDRIPVRVQRRRTKGWKMPDNTLSATRPGKFGNPYKIGDHCGWAIIRRDLGNRSLRDVLIEKYGEPIYKTTEDTIEGFKQKVMASEAFQRMIKRKFRGKNIACWCKLTNPCHVDFLLEVANS